MSKYEVNFNITFDMGNNIGKDIHGVLVADHEVTEQELLERDWGIDGKIISLTFNCRKVE